MSEKAHADDPKRCQGVTSFGQCNNLADGDSKFCSIHGANTAYKAETRKTERYLIEEQQLRSSYLRQRDDVNYLDMRDEILLLQALLERRLNQIQTDADCMLAIGPVTQITARLESMKVALLKINQQLGLVIGKDHLLQLARSIADILDEELDGIDNKEERLESISVRIVDAIDAAGTPDKS